MEILRALGAFIEPPGAAHGRLAGLLELGEPPAAADHTELFVFELHPYASVYLGAEGMLGGEARDRIAGFWRALDRTPPAEPDHLAVMLAAYAGLRELEEEAGSERRDGARHARRVYLWEHLLSWLPPWLEKLAEIAPPVYRRWGELLAAALVREAAELGEPEALPLHLRRAPPLADPREHGARAFPGALLAAVRSGVVLVRADLRRLARELGLGLRAGERRYALEALLAQDAAAVLGWLAGEAAVWTGRHRRSGVGSAVIAQWWAERAATSAELLAELERDARAAGAG